MNEIEIGATVRIGNGKVDYRYEGPKHNDASKAVVESKTTGRITTVDRTRLVLIESAPEPLTGMAELILPDLTPAGTKPISDEAWGEGPDVDEEKVSAEWDRMWTELDEMYPQEVMDAVGAKVDETFPDKNDHRESTYGKAILGALNRLGKHVYAGTGTSKRRNKTQKKAEKARRRQARDERRAAYEASRTVV